MTNHAPQFSEKIAAMRECVRDVNQEIQSRLDAIALDFPQTGPRDERIVALYERLLRQFPDSFGQLLRELMPDASGEVRAFIMKHPQFFRNYIELIGAAFKALTIAVESFHRPHDRPRRLREFVRTAIRLAIVDKIEQLHGRVENRDPVLRAAREPWPEHAYSDECDPMNEPLRNRRVDGPESWPGRAPRRAQHHGRELVSAW